MPRFSVRARLQSFRHAISGLQLLLKAEHNAWIHMSIALLAIAAGVILELNHLEWCLIIVCICTVIALEAINTAVEKMCNFVSPSRHLEIGKIKDLAAAAVLMGALMSALIGCIIFIPKIFMHF